MPKPIAYVSTSRSARDAAKASLRANGYAVRAS